jgi:hypothetical protein
VKPWAVDLGKLFKDRDNKPLSGMALATVITPLPEISIALSDEIILDKEDLILSSRIVELMLQAGDQVILYPAAGGQFYAVMDKVGS